jgi:GTP:adenosylcobinamide-phosphate guanylyltransferase
MKAVITAGGRIDGAFASEAGTYVKALAPIRGVSMLDRIIEALRANGAERIAVVGGKEVRAACDGRVERVVDETPSGSENMLRALRAWPDDGERLVYATSDLPYITPSAIAAFLTRVPDGTLAIALSRYDAFCRRFPGAPPFGITLAGERVVNGGVFTVPFGSVERLTAVATGFFEARKRPWRMASLVGTAMLVRFLLRRLRVADLEARAQRVLSMPARAIRDCAPELAYDVDTFEEYTYACAHD